MGGASVQYWTRIAERFGLDLDGGQPDRRSALRVHDARPRRQDPDGLLQPLRDGRPARAARSLRRRVRQRHRRRSPRHRHADRGPDEPESLPGRRDRLPLHAPRRLAGGRRRRQDAGVEHADRPRRRARSGASVREVPVGFKWFVPGLRRRQPRLRRRGERRRQLPAPRRRRVDHRQGRHHPGPARRGDHRRHRQGSRRRTTSACASGSGRRTTRASTRPPRPPRRPRSASSRPRR